MAGSSQDSLKAGPRKLVLSESQSRRRPRVLSPILTMNAGHQVEATFVEIRDDGDPIEVQDSHHFAKHGLGFIEVMQNVHHRDASEVPIRIGEVRGIAVNETDALLQPSFRAQQSGKFLLHGVQIDRHDIQSGPRQLDGEKPLARSHVEGGPMKHSTTGDDEPRRGCAVEASLLVEQIPRSEDLHAIIGTQVRPSESGLEPTACVKLTFRERMARRRLPPP